jgi:hypothetical protein
MWPFGWRQCKVLPWRPEKLFSYQFEQPTAAVLTPLQSLQHFAALSGRRAEWQINLLLEDEPFNGQKRDYIEQLTDEPRGGSINSTYKLSRAGREGGVAEFLNKNNK